MKKNLFSTGAMLCLALMLLVTSCAKNRLQEAVDQFSRYCPMSLGEDYGTLESVNYENDLVSMNYELTETILDITSMKVKPELIERNVLMNFSSAKDHFKTFLETINEAGADLRVIMKGLKSGEELSFTITNEEIKKAMRSDPATPMTQLKAMVESANLYAPKTITDGFVLKEMSIEDDVVYYNYELDEDLYDLDALELVKENLKEETAQELRNSQPIEITDLRRVSEAGCMLGYRYRGKTSGKTVTYYFSVEEQKEFFHLN